MDHASAALADAAAVFRSDEAERIAKHPQQGRRRIDVVADLILFAVDVELKHAELLGAKSVNAESLGQIRMRRNRVLSRVAASGGGHET
jgi:hypothetical protein